MGDTSPNHTSTSNRNPTFYHISYRYLGALGNRSLTPLKGSTKGLRQRSGDWNLRSIWRSKYLQVQGLHSNIKESSPTNLYGFGYRNSKTWSQTPATPLQCSQFWKSCKAAGTIDELAPSTVITVAAAKAGITPHSIPSGPALPTPSD